MRWKEEKKLNCETFGTTGYYRRGRGRGNMNNYRGRGGMRGQTRGGGGGMGGYRGYRRNNSDWINYEYNFNDQNNGQSNRRIHKNKNPHSSQAEIEVIV